MAETHLPLRETHFIGSGVTERIVNGALCPPLRSFGIGLTGVTDVGITAEGEFRFARPRPRTGQLLVCLEGEGRTWVGGEWTTLRSGQAYVTPPRAPHSYHALPGVRWRLCWVIFNAHEGEGGDVPPMAGLTSPQIRAAEGNSLATSIDGLYREVIGDGGGSPGIVRLWTEMVYAQALRLLEGPSPPPSLLAGEDARLNRLWAAVEASLHYPWTMSELAQRVNLSEEQVRRLCQRRLGVSPMRHITRLRMRHAAALLASDSYTVAAVARQVGYESEFAFSTAFKRVLGCSPSTYRSAHFAR